MRFFTILTTLLLFSPFFHELQAQGCVAIRGMSGCGGSMGGSINLTQGEFMALTGARYFKSFRHFRGHEQETNRIEEGTQVINHSAFLDLSLSYGITDRLYANVVLPLVYNTRSSMYEHGGNPPNGLGERHSTSSQGLGDMRLSVGYWLFDHEKVHNFNYALGLGVKLPTGKYDYMDTFYNQGPDRSETREAVVDQSIQPGDGGTGITLDLQGFHSISPSFTLTTTLYYLFNWQETNGVLTRNGRSEFSVADQYAARIGLFYNPAIQGFSAYLGGRIEGIPAKDIIGGDAGYRRPGYAISVEPGVSYNKNHLSVNFTLPVALIRNRTQSYEDKERSISSGMTVHGDAAFADYLVNLTVAYRFGGNHKVKDIIIND